MPVDPTLHDVLKAIAELRAEVDGKLGVIRSEAAAHRAETATVRAEMAKRFSDIDGELEGHTRTHNEIAIDITNLKGRPARTAARPTRAPKR